MKKVKMSKHDKMIGSLRWLFSIFLFCFFLFVYGGWVDYFGIQSVELVFKSQ